MTAGWVPEVDPAGFTALLGSPGALETLSAATGVPVLVVDLTGPPEPGGAGSLAALADVVAALPCVIVGVARGPVPPAVAPLAATLDVVLATTEVTLPGVVVPAHLDGALDRLVATIGAAPLAATAVALLLRGAERRGIGEGLVAESATYSALQEGPEFRRWRGSRPILGPEPEPGPVVRGVRGDGIVHLTLARPHRHNAFSTAMRDQLVEWLNLALAEPGLRVVIDAEGPSFCSGGDLDEFGSRDDPASAHVVRLTRSAGLLLSRLADRTEVRVHGACLGAGVELPAFSSRVVARPDAFFGLPEVGLGLVPGAGGTVSLPRRIGRQRTAWLALSGDRLDAVTALRWGLIDEVTTV